MEDSSAIVVVAGPTASGKSDLALRLAQEFNGELICSDSMQVYRQFDIGTAKPTLSEQKLVPHHQLDLIDPDGIVLGRALGIRDWASPDLLAFINSRLK